MKQIPLTSDKVALVDDEDYECLSRYKWNAYKHRNTWYAHRNEGPTTIRMHRSILRLAPDDGIQADHRDGNGLNNQKENLRKCSGVQNRRNQRARSDKIHSKFKGVGLSVDHERAKPWRARITINGRAFTIGSFYTEEAAALAYNEAASRHFGEFARLNVLDSRA